VLRDGARIGASAPAQAAPPPPAPPSTSAAAAPAPAAAEDDESSREWKDIPLEFDSSHLGGSSAGDVGLEKNDNDTPDAGLDLS
jgi:hypothetical protein